IGKGAGGGKGENSGGAALFKKKKKTEEDYSAGPQRKEFTGGCTHDGQVTCTHHMRQHHTTGVLLRLPDCFFSFFFFQAEDGIRDWSVTGVQTCALPI